MTQQQPLRQICQNPTDSTVREDGCTTRQPYTLYIRLRRDKEPSAAQCRPSGGEAWMRQTGSLHVLCSITTTPLPPLLLCVGLLYTILYGNVISSATSVHYAFLSVGCCREASSLWVPTPHGLPPTLRTSRLLWLAVLDSVRRLRQSTQRGQQVAGCCAVATLVHAPADAIAASLCLCRHLACLPACRFQRRETTLHCMC
jgi:hypothetical protein